MRSSAHVWLRAADADPIVALDRGSVGPGLSRPLLAGLTNNDFKDPNPR